MLIFINFHLIALTFFNAASLPCLAIFAIQNQKYYHDRYGH